MRGNKPRSVNPHTSLFDPAAPDVLDHVWAGGMYATHQDVCLPMIRRDGKYGDLMGLSFLTPVIRDSLSFSGNRNGHGQSPSSWPILN